LDVHTIRCMVNSIIQVVVVTKTDMCMLTIMFN